MRALLRARRMGCARCYAAFGEALEPLRAFLAGSDDPAPGVSANWRRQRALALELQEAVLTERFERAAELRDELRRLRRGG